MRKILVVFVGLALLLVAVPCVQAWEWAYAPNTWGTWNNFTIRDWNVTSGFNNGGGSFRAEYLNNFTGFVAHFNVTELTSYKVNWWDSNACEDVYLRFVLDDSAEHHGVLLRLYDLQNSWGFLHDVGIQVGYGDASDLANWHHWYGGEGMNHLYLNPSYIDLEVYRVNSTSLGMRVTYILSSDIFGSGAKLAFLNENVSVSSTFFFAPTLNVTVEHYGSGSFCGGMMYHMYLDCPYVAGDYQGASDVPGYSLFDVFSDFGDVLRNAAPASVRPLIDTFNQWFGGLAEILVTVWDVAVQLLTFAPMLLLFYALDVGMSSVSEGSFKPIGDFAMTIWGLASHLISAIVGIAGVVWDFVKFW